MTKPVSKLQLPARVVYQLDRQIADLEKLISQKRERLEALKFARSQIEKESRDD